MKQHRQWALVVMGRALAVVVGTLALVLVGFPLFLTLAMVGAIVPAAQEQRTIDCRGSLASTGEWRVPFVDASYRVTSRFGMRFHPIRHVWTLHNGTDLATAQTTVVAASSGVITASGMDRTGFGNRVIIDHGSGITTLYGHLDRIDPTITVGSPVRIGQALGLEGSTGYSTAIHLHFTITVNGTDIDPEPFMRAHGAPLNGLPVAANAVPAPAGVEEGGVGFALPEAGERQASLTNPPTPIPVAVRALYVAAARRFGLPWTLLAGIGMEETNHGRNAATSYAGAQGLMQFMPATFASYGIDGDNDGLALITSDGDSIYSAANYLAASGATRGPDGVTRALFAYNHATWYVGDVLYYAHTYGGGQACTPDVGTLPDGPDGPCPPSGSPAEHGLQPNALRSLRCVKATFPWITSMGGVGGRPNKSDHPAGRAVDFMIPNWNTPEGTANGWKVAQWLQQNAAELNVTYIIFDDHIWRSNRASQGWQPYTHPTGSTNPTVRHQDHVHSSHD